MGHDRSHLYTGRSWIHGDASICIGAISQWVKQGEPGFNELGQQFLIATGAYVRPDCFGALLFIICVVAGVGLLISPIMRPTVALFSREVFGTGHRKMQEDRVRVKGIASRAGDLQFVDQDRVDAAKKRPAVSLPDDPLVAGFDVCYHISFKPN